MKFIEIMKSRLMSSNKKMIKYLCIYFLLFFSLFINTAQATTFTETVPNGNGAIPSTYPRVGGTMVVLIGANGNIYYQFVNPSTQFQGFQNSGTPTAYQGNPFQLGPTQTLNCGPTACIDYFGGSIVEGYARLTARDGDACPGNFDVNNVFFRLNGYTVSSFTGPYTQRTNMAGTVSNGFENCFRNQGSTETSTSWFDLGAVSGLLNDILTTGSTTPEVYDTDPNDNYWYFRDGNDASGTPEVAPGITIVKTANKTSYSTVGEAIIYSFEVKNIGSVTLNSIVVTDSYITGAISCPKTSLISNESMVCTAVHNVTQQNIDDDDVFVNTAEVNALPTEGTVGNVSGTLTIPGPTVDPVLSLTKVASKTSDAVVGDIITYTYTVSNIGVLTVENITISDIHNGSGTLSAIADDEITVNTNNLSSDAAKNGSIDILAPGDSATFTSQYTVTQADIDAGTDITNTATATGTPKRGSLTDPTASETVSLLVSTPEFEVTKLTSSNPTQAGDTLNYTFDVDNTGSITISNIVITDAKCATTPVLVSGDSNSDTNLDVNEIHRYSCTSIAVTQAEVDAGTVDNSVSVAGTTVSGAVDPATNSIQTPITRSPAWTLSKTSSSLPTKKDDVVVYSFTLKNMGNVTISGVSLIDTKCDAGTISLDNGDNAPTGTLEVDETWEYSCDHTVTQAEVDAGEVVNNATAKGTVAGGITLTDATATNTISITPAPASTLTKTAITPYVFDVGEKVTYEYIVTNTGNVTLTTQITISDNLITDPADFDCDPWPASGVAPLATYKCEGEYTVTLNDVELGSATNLATASSGAMTSPTASETIPNGANPNITIAKSSVDTTYATVGQKLTYTYTITNTGDSAFVNDIDVTDDKIGLLNCWTSTTADPSFSKDDVTTCTGEYTVTQADLDAGSVTNEASASTVFIGPGGATTNVTTPSVDLTINATQDPEWVLTKTTNSKPTKKDDVVSYSFSLENTGNVSITNVNLTDVKCNSGTLSLDSGDNAPIDTLNVGETWVYSCEHTVTQAEVDAGSIVNNASATGTTTSGNMDPAPATNTITIVSDPKWTLTKTSSSTPTKQGDVVAYSFSLENTGNVTVSGITLNDTQCDALPTSPISGDVSNPGVLDTDETWVYSCNHTVIQDEVDAGSVVNNASATGTPEGTESLAAAPATNTISITPTPSWALTKTSSSTPTKEGDVVAYSFSLENTGNVTVSGITLNDAQCNAVPSSPVSGDVSNPGVLDTDETWIYSCNHTVTQAEVDAGSVVNNASATGTPAGTESLSDVSATNTISITAAPSWTLDKTTSSSPTKENDTVTYSFSLENTGNVTVSGISLIDAQCDTAPTTPDSGDAVNPGVLDADETWVYSCDHTVTQAEVDAGKVVNNASATGTPEGTESLADAPATNTITITPAPAWTLDKTSGSTPTKENDTVTYSFSLDNTGNVTISNITLSDAKCNSAPTVPDSGDTNNSGTLDANETWIYSCDYTVTQAEVDAGAVINNASASGSPAGGSLDPVLATKTISISPAPSWELSKNSSSTPTKKDDVIVYSFSLENTGNVTIGSVSLVDVNCDSGTLTFDSGDVSNPDILDADETWIYSCDHTVTQAEVDAGVVVNNASATGTPAGTATLADASATKTIAITPAPSLTVTKKAILPFVFDLDLGVDYEYIVTNTGNVTLTDQIIITDNLITDPLDISCDPWPTNPAPLADGVLPTDTYRCVGTYKVTANDLLLGSATNLATASSGGTTSPTASVTIPNGADPAIKLGKTSVNTSFTTLGETINYTYTLTNTGNAAFVKKIEVSDNKINNGTPFTCWEPTAGDLTFSPEVPLISPAQVATCSKPYTITQEDLDNGYVTNEASAITEFVGPDNNSFVSAPAVDLTINAGQDPEWKLTKTTSSVPTKKDDVIIYNFSLDNTGNVTISSVDLVDTQCDAGTLTLDSGDVANTGKLDTSEVWIYSCEHTVTQAEVDAGSVVNNASATGTPAGTESLEDASATKTITITPDPNWTLTKQSTSKPASVGQIAAYTFNLKNTGNVTISGVSLTDAQCDIATLTLDGGDVSNSGILDPDETWVYSCEHSVTQDEIDAGVVINNASATGTPAGSVALKDAAATFNIALSRTSSWTLNKTSSSTPTAANQLVDYSFALENTGNVSITAVNLTDVKCDATALALVSGDNVPYNVLDYDEIWTYSCQHTTTQEEIDSGFINNTANAEGVTEQGNLPDIDASHSITVTAAPLLSLVKSDATLKTDADGSLDITLGDTLEYTITATNDGNITLKNVIVSDAQLSPASKTCLTVTPGNTCLLTGDHIVTLAEANAGKVVNIAGGVSDEITTSVPSNSVTTTVVQNPEYTMTKTSDTADIGVPGTISYTFTFKNTGNVNLTDLTVADTNIDTGTLSNCPIANLSVGATAICTATRTIDRVQIRDGDDLTNTAIPSAKGPDGITSAIEDDTANDNSTTTTVTTKADLSVTKTLLTSSPYIPGQKIYYEIVVTNSASSWSDATNVVVTDLPTNLTITNVSSTNCSALPCTIPLLLIGASETITVEATAP
ncbi:hypothetical protein [uncultured Cocleimonas sp.]|uniref:DUF7507 domain-containing protein n=1 Tax=uncultured Cocleimonas sp. TaxID=1051587 RepID=UPI00263536F4|nr:hypothetical protein [uncultured Cocleimonas sp.]